MITLTDIHFAYRAENILNGLSLNITAGEFTAIIGANGAGKSTLLRVMAGMLAPQRGAVRLAGRPMAVYSRREIARRLGFVSQSFQTAFDFSVRDIVAMGRYPYGQPFAAESAADRDKVEQAMLDTEIQGFRERTFSSLSGGERQRVILASALCQQPEVLLLDEPTSALDLHHQQRFHDILQHLSEKKSLTVVIVTHDINLATRYCRRLLSMKAGKIISDGAPAQVVTTALMAAVYDTEVAVTVHPHDGKPLVTLP